MQNMDPKSTRAQFETVGTPSEIAKMKTQSLPYAVKVAHVESPTGGMRMDTPGTMDLSACEDALTGAWAAGLFDCFQHCVPNCCMVTFCPCISLAQISSRLGVASYSCALVALMLVTVLELAFFVVIWTPHSDDDSDASVGRLHSQDADSDSDSELVNVTFVNLTVFMQVLVCIYIWRLRAMTRSRFQIPGNMAMDCLSAWCCSCCAVAQIATHVHSYKPGTCSFSASNTLPGYPQETYA